MTFCRFSEAAGAESGSGQEGGDPFWKGRSQKVLSKFQKNLNQKCLHLRVVTGSNSHLIVDSLLEAGQTSIVTSIVILLWWQNLCRIQESFGPFRTSLRRQHTALPLIMSNFRKRNPCSSKKHDSYKWTSGGQTLVQSTIQNQDPNTRAQQLWNLPSTPGVKANIGCHGIGEKQMA